MGRKRNKMNYWQSAKMNDAQYRFYYDYLEQMACSIYRWEGLPLEIDERYLELCLLEQGLSVFFFDEEFDAYFALRGSASGKINMYSNPLEYIAYGTNGFQRRLKSIDCVPIWNNYLRKPDVNALQIYARRLADIDRTLDVNLYAQKMPVFCIVPESQKFTAMNLIKQYSGNEPAIIAADGMFDPSQFSYLSSGVPFIGNDLLQAKFTIWSEIMTYFGINNTAITKAERVQSAEVFSNNGQIETARLIRLNNRRYACKQIKNRYGIDVWCDFNRDVASENYYAVMSIGNNPMTEEDEEVDDGNA